MGKDQHPKPSSTVLRVYNGSIVKPLGWDVLHAVCRLGRNIRQVKIHFEIVEFGPITLLSGSTCEKLGLLQVNEEHVRHYTIQEQSPLTKEEVLREFRDVFTVLVTLESYTFIQTKQLSRSRIIHGESRSRCRGILKLNCRAWKQTG